MKASEAKVVWIAGGAVDVVPRKHLVQKMLSLYPDTLGEMGQFRASTYIETVACMMTVFQILVVREKISVNDAHKAFLKIEEYRHISSSWSGTT